MKRLRVILFLLVLFFAPACANFQVAGEVATGREALLQENPKLALAHFRQAAEMNPDFYLNWSLLQQGVWTYVGRAYYATGDMGEARAALEKATSRYSWDNMAKLYLGLVLLRQNDRAQGSQGGRCRSPGVLRLDQLCEHNQRPDGSLLGSRGIHQAANRTNARLDSGEGAPCRKSSLRASTSGGEWKRKWISPAGSGCAATRSCASLKYDGTCGSAVRDFDGSKDSGLLTVQNGYGRSL